MGRNPHHLTPELEELARRLHHERPEATGLELDRVKRRAITQASAGHRAWAPKKGLLMKPRIAVTFVLAIGLLTSGTGATLAVISESGSAAQVQYPDLKPNTADPQRFGGDSTATASVREEEQVASSGGGELPFTGFLAIPLLVAGVAFLVVGGVMRSRTGREPSA